MLNACNKRIPLTSYDVYNQSLRFYYAFIRIYMRAKIPMQTEDSKS